MKYDNLTINYYFFSKIRLDYMCKVFCYVTNVKGYVFTFSWQKHTLLAFIFFSITIWISMS